MNNNRRNRISPVPGIAGTLTYLFMIGLFTWLIIWPGINVQAASTDKALAALEAQGLSLSGGGTKDNPWKIGNISQLEGLRKAVAGGQSFKGRYFKLTDGITLPKDWEGIGTLKDGASDGGNGQNILPFSGRLIGGDHTITVAEGGKPLFGYVRGAAIRNLKISGKYIKGNGLIDHYVKDYGKNNSEAQKTANVDNVTILSGTRIKGSGIISGCGAPGNIVVIRNCVVEEGVTIGCDKDEEKIGSIAGDFNGTITGCTSAAIVYGTSYVGGIMGSKCISGGLTTISNCIFTGQVIAGESFAGGIAGGGYGGTNGGINKAPNANMLSITNCLVTGAVEAEDVAGGIEGYETSLQVWQDGEGYIKSNLFIGSILTNKGKNIGAIVGAFRGLDKYNVVKDNYYLENCGSDRGIGKVDYVDTSCSEHETTYGKNYINTQKSIPVIDDIDGNLKKDHNRNDDPLGIDSDRLASLGTNAQMSGGDLLEWMNSAAGTLGNWKQDGNYITLKIDPLTEADYNYGDETEDDEDSGNNNDNNNKQPVSQDDPTTENKDSTATTEKKVLVTKLTLNHHSLRLKKGRSTSLKCKVKPSKASNKKLKWSSSNSSIAKVNSKGKITGKRTGTVTITVKAKDGSKKKDTCTVTVYTTSSTSTTRKRTTTYSTTSYRRTTYSTSSTSSTYSTSSTSSTYSTSSTSSSTYSTGSTSSSTTSSGSAYVSSSTSSDTSTSSIGSSTTGTDSTGASTWNYDTDTAYPDDEEGDEDDEEYDDEEYDDEEYDDEDEDDEDEEDENEKKKKTALSVLLGLIGSGGLAGSFMIPWGALASKISILHFIPK